MARELLLLLLQLMRSRKESVARARAGMHLKAVQRPTIICRTDPTSRKWLLVLGNLTLSGPLLRRAKRVLRTAEAEVHPRWL